MLNLKYRLARVLAALLIVILALPPLNGALAQPKTVTLVHTNDMHASFLPHEATWVRDRPKPFVGGFPVLQYLIDSIRNANPPILLLDAGDVMTGNPITDRPFNGADGGAPETTTSIFPRKTFGPWSVLPGSPHSAPTWSTTRVNSSSGRFPIWWSTGEG
jgi:hypothetical protein